ncbi:UNVERIFIED_CONTAM: hypothetical protein K2H54_039969 [Gekko kuhli]
MSDKYLSYKGILFPKMGYLEEGLSYLENEFQILDDDIINLTYPKSANHHVHKLIHRRGVGSWATVILLSLSHEAFKEIGDVLKRDSNVRFLASHLPFQLFPKSFFHSKAKIIFTMRNPKDVMISLYHFGKSLKALKEPKCLEELLEEFLGGKVPYGSWFDHVKGWMKLKGRDNFFLVTYEELQQDLRGCVEKICRFVGKELTSQQINSVVENSSFQKMKDNKMCNFTLLPDTYMDHQKGLLLRKGICGDWKNHLMPKQEHFDRVYREKMQDMSMAFPWD